MAAKSFLAKHGLRSKILGAVGALAIAAPIAADSDSTDAHTGADRIGWYFDRTLAAEKIGTVVMGTEVVSTFADHLAIPLTTDATAPTATGVLRVAGGAGVAKALHVGTDLSAARGFANAQTQGLGHTITAGSQDFVAMGDSLQLASGGVAAADIVLLGYNINHEDGNNCIGIGTGLFLDEADTILVGVGASSAASLTIGIGNNVYTGGQDNVVIGHDATGADTGTTQCVVLGNQALVEQSDCISIGFQSNAAGSGVVSIGSLAGDTYATNPDDARDSVIVGYNASITVAALQTAINSVVIGHDASLNATAGVTDSCIVIGDGASVTATSLNSQGVICLGDGAAHEDGNNAICIGTGARSRAGGQIIIGSGANPGNRNPSDLILIGTNADATIFTARATGIGADCEVSADDTVAVGNLSQAIGSSAVAVGSNTVAAGDRSVAIGYQCDARSFDATICIGANTLAREVGCIAIGDSTAARGNHGLAIGFDANMAGTSARAIQIGYMNHADGTDCIVIGSSATMASVTDPTTDLTSLICIGDNLQVSVGATYVAHDSILIGGELFVQASVRDSSDNVCIGDGSIIDNCSQAVIIGDSAYADGSTNVCTGAVAIGRGAHIDGSAGSAAQSTAIGSGAQVNDANDAVALGTSSNVTGADGAIAIGAGADANGYDQIIIGDGATGPNLGLRAIFIGAGSGLGTGAAANQVVCIGYNASVSSNDAIAIGNNCAVNGGNNNVGINSTIAHADCFAVNGVSTAAGQIVFGGNGGIAYSDFYIGNGVTNATPSDITLHGTSGSGTDIAGADFTIAGGQGTGTGAGGEILFQTAPAGTTGTALNALATVATVSETALVHNQGSVHAGIQTVTGAGGAPDATADGTDSVFYLDGNAATCTLNLDASPTTGQLYRAKSIDSTNTVTVSGNGNNIDGTASVTLVTDESLTLHFDGSEWRIV